MASSDGLLVVVPPTQRTWDPRRAQRSCGETREVEPADRSVAPEATLETRRCASRQGARGPPQGYARHGLPRTVLSHADRPVVDHGGKRSRVTNSRWSARPIRRSSPFWMRGPRRRGASSSSSATVRSSKGCCASQESKRNTRLGAEDVCVGARAGSRTRAPPREARAGRLPRRVRPVTAAFAFATTAAETGASRSPGTPTR